MSLVNEVGIFVSCENKFSENDTKSYKKNVWQDALMIDTVVIDVNTNVRHNFKTFILRAKFKLRYT